MKRYRHLTYACVALTIVISVLAYHWVRKVEAGEARYWQAVKEGTIKHGR